MSFSNPLARVTIDRDRAAALDVPISTIGETLNLLVSNAQVSKFDHEGSAYKIVPQVIDDYRADPENLGNFYVRSANGEMVPLSAVIDVKTKASAAAIEQFNQLNSASISALPLPTVTTGDGLTKLQKLANAAMQDGFFLDYAGQSRLEVKQGNTIIIAFLVAVVVIYLVLAAQFESFRNPFIIMMSVPLSIFSAMVPLNLGLGTLNIYTEVGLITKHGILMVAFANAQRDEHGLTKLEAIIEAARERLRPILMTTGAMVLGVAPLVISEGAGAAARYSIGLVIMTGMTIGTLFVVPMFYMYLGHADRAHAPEEDAAAPQDDPGTAQHAYLERCERPSFKTIRKTPRRSEAGVVFCALLTRSGQSEFGVDVDDVDKLVIDEFLDAKPGQFAAVAGPTYAAE